MKKFFFVCCVFLLFLLPSVILADSDLLPSSICESYEKELFQYTDSVQIVYHKGNKLYECLFYRACSYKGDVDITRERRVELIDQLDVAKGKKKYYQVVFHFDDFIFYVNKPKTYTDSYGRNILELEIHFWNESDKTISYNSAVRSEVYQDGIGLNNYVLGDVDVMTKIKPGKEITVIECFEYRTDRNGDSIIEMEMTPTFSNETISKIIYNLKK